MKFVPTNDRNAHRGMRTNLCKHFESSHKVFEMPFSLMQKKEKDHYVSKLTKIKVDKLNIVQFSERFKDKGRVVLNNETFDEFVRKEMKREPGT